MLKARSNERVGVEAGAPQRLDAPLEHGRHLLVIDLGRELFE